MIDELRKHVKDLIVHRQEDSWLAMAGQQVCGTAASRMRWHDHVPCMHSRSTNVTSPQHPQDVFERMQPAGCRSYRVYSSKSAPSAASRAPPRMDECIPFDEEWLHTHQSAFDMQALHMT